MADPCTQHSMTYKFKMSIHMESFIALSLLITFSQALLASQLNGLLQAPYSATFVPLHITILVLIVTTFVKSPANPLWFGIRKTFADFVLDTFPFLQEYANISHQGGREEQELMDSEDEMESTGVQFMKKKRGREKVLIDESTVDNSIYPYEDIMTPD